MTVLEMPKPHVNNPDKPVAPDHLLPSGEESGRLADFNFDIKRALGDVAASQGLSQQEPSQPEKPEPEDASKEPGYHYNRRHLLKEQ